MLRKHRRCAIGLDTGFCRFFLDRACSVAFSTACATLACVEEPGARAANFLQFPSCLSMPPKFQIQSHGLVAPHLAKPSSGSAGGLAAPLRTSTLPQQQEASTTEWRIPWQALKETAMEAAMRQSHGQMLANSELSSKASKIANLLHQLPRTETKS